MFEIGTTLRDARVRRDISLQQAEEDTKIRIKYIQAMENEDFDVLPGGTYAKGFLRTYAEYLGLDFQILLDEFNERFGTGDHREHVLQPPRTAKPKEPRKKQSYLFVAILTVAIIAVLAYLGWGNSSSQQPTLVTTTGMETGTQTEPAAPAQTMPSTVPTQTQPQRPATVQTLVFTATSTDNWVEVHKDTTDGPIVWGGTLSKGESKSLSGADLGAGKAWLMLGSPSGLDVKINGQPQQLATSVGAKYEITSSGLIRQA